VVAGGVDRIRKEARAEVSGKEEPMTTGKLEVTIKINELPTEVTTTKAGWKEFKLDCGARTVTVALRPRMWTKLTEAAANWPLWLAAISGQMGPAVGEGFVLVEPAVQVFERKAKEPKPDEGAAPASRGPLP
jgi:hypothetical protein